MKKSLIALGIILLCIIIIAVGCSEQIKFWSNPLCVSDSNRVWINEEYNIWFVIENGHGFGKINIDGELLDFRIGTLKGGCMDFLIQHASSRRTVIHTYSRYNGENIISEVEGSDHLSIPKGTKLVFKPYPRQAEHYLPK